MSNEIIISKWVSQYSPTRTILRARVFHPVNMSRSKDIPSENEAAWTKSQMAHSCTRWRIQWHHDCPRSDHPSRSTRTNHAGASSEFSSCGCERGRCLSGESLLAFSELPRPQNHRLGCATWFLLGTESPCRRSPTGGNRRYTAGTLNKT